MDYLAWSGLFITAIIARSLPCHKGGADLDRIKLRKAVPCGI